MTIRSTLSLVLAAAALSSLGAAGCSSPGDFENVKEGDEALYGLGSLGKVWPNGVVPVCWADTTNNAALRAQIPGLLARSWSAVANVTFTGFGACAASGNQVTVVFASGSRGFTSSLGYGARTVTLISDDARTNQTHFQYEVVHEFGHALGFAHEQQRPDNWDAGTTAFQCGVASTNSDYGNYAPQYGGIYLTTRYDSASIMNYCDPLGNNTTTLSQGDIAGALLAYPFPSNAAAEVTSITPSSGPNVGGTRITITGARFDTTGKTQFYLGSNAATNVSCPTSTQCTATVPRISLQSTAASYDVQAVTGTVVSRAGAQDLYTYTAGPACTSSFSCVGIGFGFPFSVAVCPTSASFYELFGTSSQELVGTGTTYEFDTNDVGLGGVACDPTTGSCTGIVTYESSASYCGAVPPPPPPPATCDGDKRPTAKCSVGWKCCGTDGWACGFCQ